MLIISFYFGLSGRDSQVMDFRRKIPQNGVSPNPWFLKLVLFSSAVILVCIITTTIRVTRRVLLLLSEKITRNVGDISLPGFVNLYDSFIHFPVLSLSSSSDFVYQPHNAFPESEIPTKRKEHGFHYLKPNQTQFFHLSGEMVFR